MKTNAPADAFASALGALLLSDAAKTAAIEPHASKPTLVVAYSGGRDSTVLLHLAFSYSQVHQLPLRAIHVNHQLQPAASAFVEHCQRECHVLNIPLQVITVAVTRTDKGLEADARAARYAAFASALQPGDLLLLGQHADDQLETLMLQLLRGAGPLGLASMPKLAACGSGQLCRPLLDLRRDALTALATQRGWRWIDDPSNDDHRLARNRLRAELMPVLLNQREGAAGVLLRAVQWQAEAADLLTDLAALDAAAVQQTNGLLSRTQLRTLAPARQTNLLRWWLQQQQVSMPNADRLQSFLAQLGSDSDQVVLRWAEWQLRVWRDRLVLLPAWPTPDAILSWPDWQQPLTLPSGNATLQFDPATPQASCPKTLALRPPRADETVTVRWQTPGLKLALPGRQGRRELKDVFQEAGVPAWLRPHWPRLFYGEECVAIPGICVTRNGATAIETAICSLAGQGTLFTILARLQTSDAL